MSRHRQFPSGRLAAALAAALLLVAAQAATAMPKSEAWPRWEAHDPGSEAVIDHDEWRGFLSAYVVADDDGVNRVRYGRVGAAGRGRLEAYIESLAAVPISAYRRAEQLAYWVNLYNALTVKVVLARYPVASILYIGISPGWLSIGPWKKALIVVEGQALSLDDIEHRILRPIWRDPRIHYVVNCASIGCPNLGRDAYAGATIEDALTAAARAYVNNWRGVMFERGELYVSSLYKWYREDFGDSDDAVIAHLGAHAEPALAELLSRARDIRGHYYDWALNDARPPF